MALIAGGQTRPFFLASQERAGRNCDFGEEKRPAATTRGRRELSHDRRYAVSARPERQLSQSQLNNSI